MMYQSICKHCPSSLQQFIRDYRLLHSSILEILHLQQLHSTGNSLISIAVYIKQLLCACWVCMM